MDTKLKPAPCASTDVKGFKVGDLVTCIDDRGYDKMKNGDVLLVTEVDGRTNGMYVAHPESPQESFWCFEYRFKPFNTEIPTAMDYTTTGPEIAWDADEASVKDEEILAAASARVSSNPKDIIGVTKPSFELVPMAAVMRTNEAFKDGSIKYGAFNWRETAVRADVYFNAAMRHMTQWYHGDDKARDSGVDHRAHAIACMMILMDAEDQGTLIDNRPKVGRPLDDFILENTRK